MEKIPPSWAPDTCWLIRFPPVAQKMQEKQDRSFFSVSQYVEKAVGVYLNESPPLAQT